MTTPGGIFKRMMLNLPPSAGDYGAVRAAAELSELLGADLVATFLEDPNLLGLSALQCVRELRTVERGWRALDEAQLAHDLQRATTTARRLFAEAVQPRSIEARFEVARGPATDIASIEQPGDIVVLIEPRHPVERITQQFTNLSETAFKSASAVMVIPSRVSRKRGPVVSVATLPDDASVTLGTMIAGAMSERLIVLNASGRLVSARDFEEATQTSRARTGETERQAPMQAQTLVAALAGLRERLLVIPRGALDWRGARTMASLRSIPVLLTDAQDSAQSAKKKIYATER